MKRSPWQELLLLLVLFVGINFIWSPLDLGFAHARPHPYIIIILVMAARHGIGWALLSAALSCGLLLTLSRYALPVTHPSELLQRPWNFILASWIILGAAVGGATEAWKRNEHKLSKRLKEMEEDFEENRRRLEIAESENLELRKKVLGEGDTLSTVYEMARRLITLTDSDLFQASLELVERFVGSSHCSIYLLDQERLNFVLREERGAGTRALPKELPRGEVLFEKCLREVRVVSVKDLFSAEKPRQKVGAVLVAPLGITEDESKGEHGVLVLHQIPMEQINAQSVGVLRLLADWVSRSMNLVEKYEAAEDATSDIAKEIQKRRFSSNFIQTLARMTNLDELSMAVLSSEESSEIGYWNASKMLGLATESVVIGKEDEVLKALNTLLENGSHLGAVLTSLPIRSGLPGCHGLRLRIQERAELNAQATVRMLKLFITRYHSGYIQDLYALDNEKSPSRRQYHLDNILDGLEVLSKKKESVAYSLGLNRPVPLRVTTGDLLLSLSHSADRWTRRLAALASYELDNKVEQEILESLIHSDVELDQEVGNHISEILMSS